MKDALPEIPVNEIFTALRKTKAGKSLKKALRFDPFRQPHESPAHWKKVLGPSSSTLSHMLHMYKTTKKFLKHELRIHPKRFTHAQQKTLLLAALCHDFGEAILDEKSVGDIAAPSKNEDHEKLEIEVFKKVLKLMDLNPKLKKQIWNAFQEVCCNRNSKLYKFFHVIEHVDYLTTGLNVHKNLPKKLTVQRNKHLIGQILVFSIKLIIDESEKHPSIHAFLQKNKHQFHHAFLYCKGEYLRAESRRKVIPGMKTSWVYWQEFYIETRV